MIDGFLMGPSPLIQTVAREYDSTATYRVGDYCTRDGKIYKCTTAISTAEDFNTSHWEFVVICDEFASQLGIVEKTNTATHNITSGQYVIWKGLLYTASSTITSGDTLSDSNLTRVENGGLNSLSSNITTVKEINLNTSGVTAFQYGGVVCIGTLGVAPTNIASALNTYAPKPKNNYLIMQLYSGSAVGYVAYVNNTWTPSGSAGAGCLTYITDEIRMI